MNRILLWAFCLLFCACEGDETITFEWTDLKLSHVDNSSYWPTECFCDSIGREVYGLRLNLFPRELSKKGRYFDPYESSVINANRIDSIHLSSLQHWVEEDNDTLYAGTALNHKFMTFNQSYGYTDTLGMRFFEPTFFHHEDYADQYLPSYGDLLLMEPPQTSMQQFRVYLRFRNGMVKVDTSKGIYLR